MHDLEVKEYLNGPERKIKSFTFEKNRMKMPFSRNDEIIMSDL